MPAKRTSAFSRALQEAQSNTVSPQDSRTVSQLNSSTEESPVTPSHRQTVLGSETVTPFHSETVQPSHRSSVQPLHRETEEDERVVKTSFYPTPHQLEKLDDLASAYNKRYRRQRPRINRNDIVRYLIDQCEIDSLADLHSL